MDTLLKLKIPHKRGKARRLLGTLAWNNVKKKKPKPNKHWYCNLVYVKVNKMHNQLFEMHVTITDSDGFNFLLG